MGCRTLGAMRRAARTGVLAGGLQGGEKRGQVGEKVGAQKRASGGRDSGAGCPCCLGCQKRDRALLTGHHAMSLPARK